MSETSPAGTPGARSPAVIALDDRSVIIVSGRDAASFLHNLLTADIAGLAPGEGRLAALLTPQGKIIADMLVFNASDDEPLFIVDAGIGFAGDLVDRLARYRLRADVMIERLGPPIAVTACLDCPPIGGEAFYSFQDPRAPDLGQRLYGPAETLTAATGGIPAGDPAAYHARRVALAIPEAGKDYGPADAFPHEANLDQLGGVDFRKGCYIGQEIVSRMEHRGTARTRAVGVRFLNGHGVIGGADVTAGARPIGRVGESFGDRAIALVRLDRMVEARQAGETVLAGGVPVDLAIPSYARFTFPDR